MTTAFTNRRDGLFDLTVVRSDARESTDCPKSSPLGKIDRDQRLPSSFHETGAYMGVLGA